MKNKYEFDRFVSKMGLDDAEMSLAELVWRKAEESFDAKDKTKVAALLGGFNGVSSNDLRVKPKSKVTQKLTQAELQFLRSFISVEIEFCELQEKTIKSVASSLWQQCDRTDPDTKQDYKNFIRYRRLQKQTNAQRKKLSIIQRKIRKMLDAGGL